MIKAENDKLYGTCERQTKKVYALIHVNQKSAYIRIQIN